jgi:1,2-dihydroxy-3-keto-5-methylthiopentene dioxygenase
MGDGGESREIVFANGAPQFTNAMRLFKEDPKWTPLNRGDDTETNEYRQEYLKTRHALAA